MERRDDWSGILAELDRGGDAAALRTRAAEVARTLPPDERRRLAAELARRGIRLDAAPSPCAGGGATSPEAFRESLPEGHVLRTMMEEHVQILDALARLAACVESTEEPSRATLERIHAIGTFLVGVEPHHAREEQVLFPALRERGVPGPPAVMEHEHRILRPLKHAIHDLSARRLAGEDVSWHLLRQTARELVEDLRAHIAKEDGILYPVAAQVIPEPETWAELRARCDAIGYFAAPAFG